MTEEGIIREMYKLGMTVEEISKKEQISKKKVKKILELQNLDSFDPEWVKWFSAEWAAAVRRLRHDGV